MADKALADKTIDAKIIHSYTKDGKTVLIDEMTDHYPVSTTFSFKDNLSLNTIQATSIKEYPNPTSNGALIIDIKDGVKN